MIKISSSIKLSVLLTGKLANLDVSLIDQETEKACEFEIIKCI